MKTIIGTIPGILDISAIVLLTASFFLLSPWGKPLITRALLGHVSALFSVDEKVIHVDVSVAVHVGFVTVLDTPPCFSKHFASSFASELFEMFKG